MRSQTPRPPATAQVRLAPSLPGPAKHPTPIQYPRRLPTLNENGTPTEGSGPSGAVPGLRLVTPVSLASSESVL